MNNLNDIAKLAIASYLNTKCSKATYDWTHCKTDCAVKFKKMVDVCPKGGYETLQPLQRVNNRLVENHTVIRSLTD